MSAGAKSCAILQPPVEKPDGWDVADALTDGFDIAGFLAVGERVPVMRELGAQDIAVPIEGTLALQGPNTGRIQPVKAVLTAP